MQEKPEIIWSNYLDVVAQSMSKPGDKTPEVLTIGLVTELFEIMKVVKTSIISPKKDIKTELTPKIGDVLWFIGALQITYDLETNRYLRMLQYELRLSEELGELNGTLMTQELLGICTEFNDSVLDNDQDGIQYTITLVTRFLFDMCAFYDVRPIDCLSANVSKFNPQKQATTTYKNYAKEFELARLEAKKSSALEVVIDVKLAPTSDKKSMYVGLLAKFGKRQKSFNSKFLIKDFFYLSNFLAKELKGLEYRLNYSEELRMILDGMKDKIIMGYISGEKLYTVSDIQKIEKESAVGKTIFVDRNKYRPVLMLHKMTELNQLLDIINNITDAEKKLTKP